MIPYGLYILTSGKKGGKYMGATVNWVTQSSFQPPQVVVAVKADSFIHAVIKENESFALNVLGKGQGDIAYAFFKSAQVEGQTIGGQTFNTRKTGAPLLKNALAHIECRLVGTLEQGDHSVFLGEVIDVGLNQELEDRPDDSTLWLKDLGEKIFYGG